MSHLRLLNTSKNLTLADEVILADNLKSRIIGLLGRSGLKSSKVMWIKNCNSIHTWFMKFPLDVIFVNKDLVVKAIYKNLKPWRMTLPILSASSVFEFEAGVIKNQNIEIGDQLNVDH